MSAHWPHHFWLTIPPLLPVLFLQSGILSQSFHNQGVANEFNLYSLEWISNNISGGKKAMMQILSKHTWYRANPTPKEWGLE